MNDNSNTKKVSVIAPSKRGLADLQEVKGYIESLGLEVDIPKNLYSPIPQPFGWAASDSVRQDLILEAFKNPESTIIWAIRGGNGAASVIEKALNYCNSCINSPEDLAKKTIVGYSDLTALMIAVQQKLGWKNIHGPMLDLASTQKVAPESQELLKGLLLDKYKSITYELIPLYNYQESREIRSSIIGGNLSLLTTTLGTDAALNSDHKILFIEEVDEPGYKVLRMLLHLKLAGAISEKTDALVFGDFTFTNAFKAVNYTVVEDVEMALAQFAKLVHIPIFRIPNIGHGYINNPLPMGTEASITSHRGAEEGELTWNMCVENVWGE